VRALAWDFGCLGAQRLGAMLGPVSFVLPDGKQCAPLHVAPWTFEPEARVLPGVLRRLRGEWPCAHFGLDATRALSPGWSATGETFPGADVPHGPASNEEWRWIDAADGSLALRLDYPDGHPVRFVERTITPDPKAPAIDFEFRVHARRACRLPLGLHPTFRLPDEVGALNLEPGAFGHVRSYPGTQEPGAALFAEDARFARLEAAPLRAGGTIDATSLPFEGAFEDLLQLVAAEGTMALRYRREGFRATLTWNAAHFPSLLLWFSNRGRRYYPWSGRNLCLGVEPVCSAFDLGPALASGPNPIADSGTPTAHNLTPDAPFATRYRIGVSPD